MSSEDHGDLAERLEAIAAEIDDRALRVLHDAMAEARAGGSGSRPVADKRLTQARRAVEKAANLLRGGAGGED